MSLAAGLGAAVLTVATYNLHNIPFKRQERMENAATALLALQPDLVALQEVGEGLVLPGKPDKKIGDRLQLPFRARAFLENALFYRNFLAILSRFPILGSAELRFSANAFLDHKGAQFARVETPGGPIAFFNFHLAPVSGGPVKQRQFTELEAFIGTHRGNDPVVLAGDFNERHDAPEFAAFLGRVRGTALFAFLPPSAQSNSWTNGYRNDCVEPRGSSENLLDHVVVLPGATRLFKFTGGGISSPTLTPHPSDHCPVHATLKLEP